MPGIAGIFGNDSPDRAEQTRALAALFAGAVMVSTRSGVLFGEAFPPQEALRPMEGCHLVLDGDAAGYRQASGLEGGAQACVKAHSGKELSLKQLHGICEVSYPDFAAKFLVYKKLREAGYVVTPGIKFGSDFAVYEHGPGIDHAPYIVQVMAPDSKMTATSMVRSGRLATTVRKQFIIAIPSAEGKSIEFLRYDWWRA